MKKINVKVTVFLSVIVLAVIILLLNFIEFRKTLDFTASGIRMLKENASGKQEEVQVDVSGTYSSSVTNPLTMMPLPGCSSALISSVTLEPTT